MMIIRKVYTLKYQDKDWKLIGKEYRKGTISINQIALKHGIPASTLKQYASKRKWKRNTQNSVKGDSKYNITYHPTLVKWMAKAGLTEAEIAKEIGVAPSTLTRWKQRYPEFADALREYKAIADTRVAESLYKRAVGFVYEEIEDTYEPFDKGDSENGGNVRLVKRVIKNKHATPDVTAIIKWLTNRQPELWRIKQNLRFNCIHDESNKHHSQPNPELTKLSSEELLI